MAQVSSIQVPNQPRSTYRSGNNAVFEAVTTDHSGPTPPPDPRSFMKWKDTSTTPATYKERNAANNAWVEIGKADTLNWGLATANNAALTGTPTCPTPAPGTQTTQVANCAFVEVPTLSWINVTFQNSFANLADPFAVVQYARSRGFLIMRGSAVRSTAGITSGMTIFNLPAGFRPAKTIEFPLDSAGNPNAKLQITAAGDVQYFYSGTPGLGGIVYPSFNFSFPL